MKLLLVGQLDADEADSWARHLQEALPEHHLLRERGVVPDGQIEVAIVANPPPGSLQGLPGLRLIQSLWAGVDRLLADATVPPQVPLARMVDPAMNEAMAETALWAVLSLHRDFFSYARQQTRQHWQQHPQHRADEWPVLVLGHGQMGQAVSRRLAAQGYPVTAWCRQARTEQPAAPGVRVISGADALATAWARAQTVVNLLPLTPETRGILNSAHFSALPRGASVVNLARGAHLVDADLLAALASGHLAHAVLDVFHAEPLAPDHPFWQHPQVTVLPHIAAQTDPRSAAAVVAANVRALAAGQALSNLVQRESGY